ncbi:MAG TPA: PAS domain S-box protein [Cyclobacteriaceae bacterium]|nr:PAS domain S-box protein [Cyclobacteriaceae bacterium]
MSGINDDITKGLIEQQRYFLAAVVDSSKDSVVTIDFNGVITSWNKAAEDLYGYPSNEAIGKNLSIVVLPDDIRQLLINIERIKNSTSVEIYDTVRVRKEGAFINLEIVLSPVKNDRGEVIGVSTIARNITEWVKAQEALAKSEAKFRALISQTAVGIYQADLDRMVTLVNDTFCSMLGFTREELIGLSLWSATFEEDVESEKKLFENFKLTRKAFEFDKRVTRKDGKVRWMKESVSPIYGPEGELQSTMGVIFDITEAKLANDQLEGTVRDRTSQLERSNVDLLQFAHVASHDLKEPLRKIRTFSYRLEDEFKNQLPANAQSYIDRIQSAVERMNTMIEGVLSYSKVNADDSRIETIDLNVLIINIEQDLEVVIEEKSAKIRAARLPILSGSPVLMYQLFYNLISNALKFSKAGVPPLISIKSELVERGGRDYFLLEISDNGIGFEQKFSKKIFDAFTRLNSKDTYEGTGLGLALCYKMVQRHGGTIDATGKPGEGATFRIFLPKAP